MARLEPGCSRAGAREWKDGIQGVAVLDPGCGRKESMECGIQDVAGLDQGCGMTRVLDWSAGHS